MKFAKALSAVANYTFRLHPERINRRLDDRNDVLISAMKNLEQRSSSVYPQITKLSAALAALSTTAPLTGLTITGVNFIGDTVKASGKTSDGVLNTQITWTAVRPGDQAITVEFVNNGGAGVVTVSGSTITVDINQGTTSASTIVANVAAHATAKFKVIGVAGGSGAGKPVAQSATLTGGVGSVPTMTIGSKTIDDTAGFGFTAWTDTVITFDFDAAAFTSGASEMILLTVDDVLCPATAVVVDSGLSAEMATLASTAGAGLVGVLDAAGATASATVEAWLAELSTFLLKPQVDGTKAKRLAQITFDPSTNAGERTQAAHSSSVTLPDNAIITRAWYEVLTTFTSATDAATISIGIPVDDVAGIVGAIAISNGANPWDAGNHEAIQTGTVANFSEKTTGARAIDFTVAGGENLTAGKLILYVEYVVSV